MEQFEPILALSYLDNTVEKYLIALGVLLITVIVIKIFKQIVLKKTKKWAKKTKTDIDDEVIRVIEDIPNLLYTYIGFYFGLKTLAVHSIIDKIADVIFIVLVIFWATKAAADLIEFILYKVGDKQKTGGKREKTTTYLAISLIVKIVLWSVGFLLILSNLGVNISALVASLGIGGIAIALAVQNILGDMFSSFSIYFDKPFEIGDYIVVGDHMGTVKRIGLKTTRVTSLGGEEIVISNQELTSTRVRNFKRMKKRRIAFHFGLVYGTPSAKLKKANGIVEKVIKKAKLADLDRVHFKEFGDSSLNFEVVYYLNSKEYLDYMNTQQEINFGIKDAFEKEGIEMAFPTQTLYVNKTK